MSMVHHWAIKGASLGNKREVTYFDTILHNTKYILLEVGWLRRPPSQHQAFKASFEGLHGNSDALPITSEALPATVETPPAGSKALQPAARPF